MGDWWGYLRGEELLELWGILFLSELLDCVSLVVPVLLNNQRCAWRGMACTSEVGR